MEKFRKEHERFEEFISSNGYLKMTVQREKDVTLVSHECEERLQDGSRVVEDEMHCGQWFILENRSTSSMHIWSWHLQRATFIKGIESFRRRNGFLWKSMAMPVSIENGETTQEKKLFLFFKYKYYMNMIEKIIMINYIEIIYYLFLHV